MNIENQISAIIIADSINYTNERITTFILVFPRIILSEFNTHRMLSKNSASSRAIPFNKMLEKVKNTPFIPIAWQKEHSGMQGTECWEKEDDVQARVHGWLMARDYAAKNAKILANDFKVTKQVCNRLLEPFLYHTVICTGTEWENFFALRAHPAAEIHIQDLAEKMLVAYNESKPNYLEEGEWHIPFGDKMDKDKLRELMPEVQPSSLTWYNNHLENLKIKIATARCARVSYDNFEGTDDYTKDIQLYDRLSSMGHFSPFEHVAKAMTHDEYYNSSISIIDDTKEIGCRTEYGWSGNFKGYVQLRKTLENENKKDKRVIKK